MGMNPRATAFALAAFITAADQAMKHWVLTSFHLDYEGAVYEIVSFFRFWLTYNHGIALGMFQAGSDAARWTLTGLLSAITLGVAWWLWTEKSRWDGVGLAMILGGAIGNLIDRVRFGYVVDYADLHFGEFRPFMIFNLADAAITMGVVLLLLRAVFVREATDATEKN